MSSDPRFPPKYAKLAEEVRRALSDEMRKPKYQGSPNPYRGHCYVASEAFYHLAGGKAAGWKPVRLNLGGDVHWWLLDADNQRVDLTSEQFDFAVPYEQGIGGGFLTREPSERAQVIIDRVRRARRG